MTIFIDASALVSLFNLKDSNNKKALLLAEELAGNKFIITGYVFAEAVTILSQRVSRDDAIYAGEYIKKNYFLIDVDKETEDLAWEIFKKQTSKNVSFVDCTAFALFKRGVFDQAFTFDKDFKNNGIKVLE